jgi:FixJ family two-component response regulator
MSDESIPSPGPTDEHPRVVLLIEDDEAVRRSLQLLLHWRGYDVRSFASAGPVLDGDGVGNIDVLVTDYRLPDGDGIGVLRALRRSGWSGKAILITAFPSTTLTESARATGFDAVLEKPLRQHELVGALAN